MPSKILEMSEPQTNTCNERRLELRVSDAKREVWTLDVPRAPDERNQSDRPTWASLQEQARGFLKGPKGLLVFKEGVKLILFRRPRLRIDAAKQCDPRSN